MRHSLQLFGSSLFLLFISAPLASLHSSEGRIIQSYRFFAAQVLPEAGFGLPLSDLARKYFALDPDGLPGEEKSTTTLWIKNSMLRIDPDSSEAVRSILFMSEKDTVLVLDHREQTCLALSVNDLGRMNKTVVTQVPGEREGEAASTREQGEGGGKTVLEKLGTTKIIGGHRCAGYMHERSESMSEVWMAEENLDLFEPYKRMTMAISKISRMNEFNEDFSLTLDLLEGFPILVKTASAAGLSVMEIRKIEKMHVPDDLFRSPEGYRKETYEDMMWEMIDAMQEHFEGSRAGGRE